MNEQTFEIVSLAMRYLFAGLMLIAVACGFRLHRLQVRNARRERKNSPNMEYVGEMLVIRGAGDVKRGEKYGIQRDIVIGRRRSSDVALYDKSVRPRHARAELRSGGMLIYAIGRAPISLRGQPIKGEILVHDGALFCIGDITLQLTLYDAEADYVVDDGEWRYISVRDPNEPDAYDGEDEDEEPEYEYDDQTEEDNYRSDMSAEFDYEPDEMPKRRWFENISRPDSKRGDEAPARRISVKRAKFEPLDAADDLEDELPDYNPDDYASNDDDGRGQGGETKRKWW